MARSVTRRLIPALAVLTLGWFVDRTVLPSWTDPSTDFPNYYTAGKLARTHRTHQSLHLYYDWTWFQRQMHFAGIEHQLGGYIPQTPLTLLPFVPLSLAPVPEARRIWLLLNCGFLGITLWLLSRMTRLNLAQLWLIAFLARDGLRNNFLLGQYYVFLLALLTCAAWCLLGRRDRSAGALLASAFVLKLYGGPWLLLAALKHRWNTVVVFLAVFAVATCCCAAWFGWDEMAKYGTQVLPRSLAGQTLNPFHPSNGTATTLLRRLFMKEGELNPHPLADNPFLFFMCQTAFTLAVMVFTALGSRRNSEPLSPRILAWWLVATLLISPNTASYTFALLILPVALLFDQLPRLRWFFVLAAFVLLGLPLSPAWSWLFPKVWLLLFLFVLIGYRELIAIPGRYAIPAMAGILAIGAVAGVTGAASARQEPSHHFAGIATEPGAIYSSSPAMARDGLLYESMGAGRYVIRSAGKTFAFPGDAFHPSAPDSGSPIYFESVLETISKIMRFDPAANQLTAVPLGIAHPEQPAVSHDGTMLAFISEGHLYLFDGLRTRLLPVSGSVHDPSFITGDTRIAFASGQPRDHYIGIADITRQTTTIVLKSTTELASPSISPDGRTLLFASLSGSNWQVRIKALATGRERELSSGRCNNFSPTWGIGPRQVVFASDCGRGLGLPALYLTPPLDDIGNLAPKSLNPEPGLPLAAPTH